MTSLERRIAAVESKAPSSEAPDVVFVTPMTTTVHRESFRAFLSRPNRGGVHRNAMETEAAFMVRVANRARESLSPGHCALVFMHPEEGERGHE